MRELFIFYLEKEIIEDKFLINKISIVIRINDRMNKFNYYENRKKSVYSTSLSVSNLNPIEF